MPPPDETYTLIFESGPLRLFRTEGGSPGFMVWIDQPHCYNELWMVRSVARLTIEEGEAMIRAMGAAECRECSDPVTPGLCEACAHSHRE